MTRWIRKLWAVGALACVGALSFAGSAQAAERMAMGLIVKLKDTTPAAASVVKLRATLRPQELASATRLRISAVTSRQRVSFLVQKPTAFGAQLVHRNALSTYAEAEAEAQRLRQDADVEWVVVNEVLRPHATVQVPLTDPRVGQQAWMTDANTGGLPNIPAAFAYLNNYPAAAHSSHAGRTLEPVRVAVLDTGVLRHPDLAGRVLFGQGIDFVWETEHSNDGDGLDFDASDPGDFLTQSTKNSNATAYSNCEVQNSSWHGTHIAGILAAGTNNGVGVAGILAPLSSAPVLPVRISGNCGASVSDIIEGMLWAAGIDYNGSPSVNPNPARVISLSFGGELGCSCANKANLNGTDAEACYYQNAIKALDAKGAILVASAGNGVRETANLGQDGATRPAACPGVIAVTSVQLDGSKAFYANLVPISGDFPDRDGLLAPATGVATMGGSGVQNDLDEGIYTTSNSGKAGPVLAGVVPVDYYGGKAGTSFASPIVAGTVALMWAVNPGLTPAEVANGLRTAGVRPWAGGGDCSAGVFDEARNYVLVSGKPGICSCTTDTCGAGVVDTALAVSWAASRPYKSYSLAAAVPPTNWFTPERVSATSNNNTSSGGGGGGAVGWAELAALALLMPAAWLRRPRR